MINVGEIINDPDLCQSFTVSRSSGQFGAGGWMENAPTSLTLLGVITPSTADELQQVPEGDRVTGAMTFYSTVILFETHDDSQSGTSDILTWRGQKYRIVRVFPYEDYGYNKAVAVRMQGA